jgi:dCTP deaminase
MLSDVDMRKEIKKGEICIEPFDETAIGPCSIDLTLDSIFRVYHPGNPIDIRGKKALDTDTKLVDTGDQPFLILPGQFILAQTRESIKLGKKFAGLLEGKSSVARLGIIVHAAGLVNPGTGLTNPGKLTLEVYCMNLSPVLLHPGMPIVQLMFVPLSSGSQKGYDERKSSRYIGQSQPEI